MDIRYPPDPVRYPRMNTQEIREAFLIETLFKRDKIQLTYSHLDRAVIGSAAPVDKPVILTPVESLRHDYFCERRELGILNIGELGTVQVDGHRHDLENEDCLYIGRGAKKISFVSANLYEPALFYLLSFPAHTEYPIQQVKKNDIEPVRLGSDEAANKRSLYKMIHPDGIKSCQLVMGITELAEGSVWNTMPPHTHDRRMEVYMYFKVPDEHRVFHFMGSPEETRHISVANGQAVLSPTWSIHAGSGTRAYSFCWGMGGENQAFNDMDLLTIEQLK